MTIAYSALDLHADRPRQRRFARRLHLRRRTPRSTFTGR